MYGCEKLCATNKKVIWSSSGISVVTVTEYAGEMVVKSVGQTIIIATTDDEMRLLYVCLTYKESFAPQLFGNIHLRSFFTK